jgi:hypothetical protein
MAVSVFRSRKIDFQSVPTDRTGLPALTLHLEQDSLSFMALLRGLLWLVLFVVLAFSFVVLFEYGPHHFASGFQK